MIPLCAAHSVENSLDVKFATTIVEVTPGSADTPPSHAIAGIGVSPPEIRAPDSEPALLALFALHAGVAMHKRPPSAAESSA
jgi:hypothetical protein